MSDLLALSSPDRAAFAVTGRLLACLVTESLLKALFLPIHSDKAVGACVVLSKHASDAGVPLEKPYRSADIFAIIPLRSLPVLKSPSHPTLGNEIGLVDPMDMLPWIYEVREDPGSLAHKLDLPSAILSSLPLQYYDLKNTTLALCLDPLYLWNKFSRAISLNPENQHAITEELRSSFLWQKHAFENAPPRPTLASSSLEWEHALIQGHPTHPMHRARRTIAPIPPLLPGQYDFYHPRVRFAVIPTAKLHIQGDFAALLAPLRAAAARNAALPLSLPSDAFLLPVHELQIPNIQLHIPDARILPAPFSVLTPAQASIRTVTLPCAPSLSLKLAVGIKISSALRTISHFTAYAAPRFGAHVVPKLALDPAVLKIEREVASVVYAHPDPDVAKHATAVLREVYDGPANGEHVILAAALAESGYDADPAPAVVTALALHTRAAKAAFLARYVDLIFAAFLPPLLTNGVAFEAHGQNVLARFSRSAPHAGGTPRLEGFVFRDFGGLRIHRATLRRSTGVELDVLPAHCIEVADVADAHKRLYHTLVHSHLHRLVRVLGMHHDGSGWRCVREALRRRVPRDSALWRAWMQGEERRTVMGKCLLRMKLEGLYRDAVYEAVPNLIHFRPEHDGHDSDSDDAAEEEEEEESG